MSTAPAIIGGQSPTIDEVGVKERVARFRTRSIKKESKKQALQLVLSMIDLTTLEGKDTEDKVRRLCQKAIHPHDALPGLPTVAAICVYPSMVKAARSALEGSGVKTASVSTAFPSGQDDLKQRISQTKRAVRDGAEEIDMVISRGRFLA
ncbi:MAG: hypothetical protein VB980_01245, partial [Opitutales bacterium]